MASITQEDRAKKELQLRLYQIDLDRGLSPAEAAARARQALERIVRSMSRRADYKRNDILGNEHYSQRIDAHIGALKPQEDWIRHLVPRKRDDRSFLEPNNELYNCCVARGLIHVKARSRFKRSNLQTKFEELGSCQGLGAHRERGDCPGAVAGVTTTFRYSMQAKLGFQSETSSKLQQRPSEIMPAPKLTSPMQRRRPP
jgi:hypothetical protein